MPFAIAGCFLALVVGADPLNEAARKELKALEGEWVLLRIGSDGKTHELGDDERAVLTIKGAKLTWTLNLGEAEVIALDTSTDPKLIDIKGALKGREPFVREGVYKLDDDTLTMCIYKGDDKKRPTGFDITKEAAVVLTVYKRVKP